MDSFDFLTAVQHERDFENSDELLRQFYDKYVADEKEFEFYLTIPECYSSVFTDGFMNKLIKANDIVREYWYDDSDVMRDYHDTNFYYDIIAVFQ